MPRILPWDPKLKTQAKQTKKTSNITGVVKRKRTRKESPDVISQEDDSPSRPVRGKRVPSSSPPPSPPEESFMEEGTDRDDRFRMVEDELLAVAQKFTVHLHAAEYKKQQKMVQNRNASTISTISRPTVGKMADGVRRRVEEAERVEKKKTVLNSFELDRSSISDDDSDTGEKLPYTRTMLHGLMDSPRRRARSLLYINNNNAATRSAAGYQKPTAYGKDLEDYKPRFGDRSTVGDNAAQVDNSVNSSGDEYDLDASSSAPRFSKTTTIKSTLVEKCPQNHTQTARFTMPVATSAGLMLNEDMSIGAVSSNHAAPPKMSRFERAQQLKAREEHTRKQKAAAADVIPKFL